MKTFTDKSRHRIFEKFDAGFLRRALKKCVCSKEKSRRKNGKKADEARHLTAKKKSRIYQTKARRELNRKFCRRQIGDSSVSVSRFDCESRDEFRRAKSASSRQTMPRRSTRAITRRKSDRTLYFSGQFRILLSSNLFPRPNAEKRQKPAAAATNDDQSEEFQPRIERMNTNYSFDFYS